MSNRSRLYNFIAGHEWKPPPSDNSNVKGPTRILRGPDDVLLRKPWAMDLFEDRGVPVIDRWELPDSNLIKSLHVYIAEYFKYHDISLKSFDSMEETALLSIGVLIEEKMKELIGENGYKMYKEGEIEGHGGAQDNQENDNQKQENEDEDD